MLRKILVLTCALGAATASHAQQGDTPPTAVAVMEMVPERVPVVTDLPGRISATRTAEVRPRVSGIVEERVFTQGSRVETGDVLYRLDAGQYRVQVASAQAQLSRAEATLALARTEAERQERLRERSVATESAYQTALTTAAQAEADVAAAQALLDEAELNLAYTEVKAPISGTIGRATLTEGALVSAQTDVMATIQQLDPVYADFTQSVAQVFSLRKAMQAGQLIAVAPGEARVQLKYDDGSSYQHSGRLLFSEATVDPSTGQVTLRAEFPNTEGDLLPGLYVRIQIEQAVRDGAMVIPQQAVQRDNGGNPFVYVLREDDTAEQRPVTLGATMGNRWLVDEGLSAGDRLVAEGAQRLQPDARTAPQPWVPEQAAQASGADQ